MMNTTHSKKPVAVVTGGAGFVGSHLCDRLLAESWRVFAVDNFLTGSRDNIKHLEDNPDFVLIEQDVTQYLKVPGSVEFVYHFASPASPVDYGEYPVKTLKAGSLGTLNALGLAKNKRAGFMIASTSEVYGDPLVHPQTESYWGNVNPVGPRGCYDEAKRFAEALTMAYLLEDKVNTHIVRIFNTYGPRMRLRDGRVVPAFISQALLSEPLTVFGDGSQTRSFCYVSDLVDGIWRLSRTDFHEPVNVGNPAEMTVRQFGEAVLKIIGSRAPIVSKPLPVDDPKQRRPDITRAQQLLGWEPKVGLDEGLRLTIPYFRERLRHAPAAG